MKKKALLIVVPLLAVLSLTMVPAFATPSVDQTYVRAVGWAFLKTSSGTCYSGCASLELFTQNPSAPSDRFASLTFQGNPNNFNWLIDLNSIKVTKNCETFCAIPTITFAGWGGVAPGPIIVTFQTKVPFCVTAFGCDCAFVGKVTTAVG